MRVLPISVLLASCLLFSEGRSFAQDVSPPLETQAPTSSSIVSVPPGQVASARYAAPPGYDPLAYELEEATRRSRTVRNALIGTSVGFAVGAILAGVGASQCDYIEYTNSDKWECNTAGDVLVPLGGTFMGLGAIGMITTGIMLGVRNKQKREIQRDIRNRYSNRFRWDVSSGQFVF